MGQMRFLVPHREQLLEGALERAYLSGMEGIPWRRWITWGDTDKESGCPVMIVDRTIEESGNLFFPWYCEGRGELMISTASLMERDEPYHLTVELARGTISRLRNQAAEWEHAGLLVPDSFNDLLKKGCGALIEAVNEQDASAAATQAEHSIQLGLEAVDVLICEYIRQALAARHQQAPRLPTLLAAQVTEVTPDGEEAESFSAAMNAISIPMNWRSVEMTAAKPDWEGLDAQITWAQGQGLRIIGGPLLQLGTDYLPDWLYLWEDDFGQIQSNVAQFIDAVVQRYRGRVQIWNCAARMNVRSKFGVSEEEKLRLIVNSIEVVRRNDPSTPLIVSFDQPWGEYLASDELELSPLHFADSLVRANLGVAGVGLEINIGYWPGGTLPRDPLDFSRLLDRWSLLGLPIVVFFSAPSGAREAGSNGEATPLPRFGDGPSPEHQQQFARKCVEVCLAKHFVQGVVWTNWRDDQQTGLAHGGLVDEQLQAKPLIEDLVELRKEHLM